jgi:hypothetical protein
MESKDKAVLLMFAANPRGDLKLDEEIRAIEEEKERSRYRDEIEFRDRQATRREDLIRLLDANNPRVVHFSGHGSSAGSPEPGARDLVAGGDGESGQIYLVGEDGQPVPVSQQALSSLFKVRKGNIGLVVLNACYTRSQAEAISRSIDCVIGTNRAIGDIAARVFAAQLYQTLFNGGTVKQAFDDACVALTICNIPEESTPVLMSREGVDPEKLRLFGPVKADAPAIPAEEAGPSVATKAVHVPAFPPADMPWFLGRHAAIGVSAVAGLGLLALAIWRWIPQPAPIPGPDHPARKVAQNDPPKPKPVDPKDSQPKGDSPPSRRILKSGDDPRAGIPWLWDNGAVLRVSFLDGPPEYQKLVKDCLDEWLKYANLNIKEVESKADAEVRAAFGESFVEPGATYALLGMQALSGPPDKPTLYLGLLKAMPEKEKRRLVLHEIGHVIGLFHEHQNPNCTNFIEFKKPDIYQYYQATAGWPHEMVEMQIMKPFDVPYRPFDPRSIMMYELPTAVVLYPGPLRPRVNEELSDSDKSFASRLYPRGNDAESPEKSERLTVNGPPVRTSIDLGVGKRFYHFTAEAAATFDLEVQAEYAGQLRVYGPDAAAEPLKSWTLDPSNPNPYRIAVEQKGRYVIGVISEFGNQMDLRVRRE